MGAPQVISTPTKSYILINSNGSDKSIPATLCDLGRVSSLATAVTLSRTSNMASRNNHTQNTRSINHKKSPIFEVLGASNSTQLNNNKSAASSIINQPNDRVPDVSGSVIHEDQTSIKNQPNDRVPDVSGSVIHEDQSSISASSAPSPQSKRIKLESTSLTSRTICSPDASRKTVVEKPQMTPSSQYHTSQTTNLPSQITILRPVQVPSQGTEAELRNYKHMTTHTQNKTVLPNQQPVLLLTPGIGKHPNQASSSIAMQLQQQNQQLRSENLIMKKQLSLFKQLMKNPERLNQILTRLEQRAH